MSANSRPKLVLQVIFLSTIVSASVVFVVVVSSPSTNLVAIASDASALSNLLTIVLFLGLFYGVLGGTVGGLLAWHAKPRLEARSLLVRTAWGLKWGTFLGFLIPATVLLISYFVSDRERFVWESAVLVFLLVGVLGGAVTGGIVGACCLRSGRRYSI